MMPKLSEREKMLVAGLGVFVSIALIVSYVVEPGLARWRSLGSEISQKSRELAQDKRLLADKKVIEDEYNRYPGIKSHDSNDESAVAEALAEIERISQTTACQIINVKPRTPVKERKFKVISFDVTGEGDISAITAFLYSVENSSQSLRVQRFTIAPSFGATGRLKATFYISKIMLS